MKTISSLVVFLLLAASCSAQIMGVGNRKVFHVSGGGGTVPSVIQSQTSGEGGSTSSLLITNPVTVGNIVIAALNYGGGSGYTLTMTDTLGNSATTLATTSLNTDGDTVAIACAPITTGGTDTLKFFVNGSQVGMRAIIYEVHGASCTQDVTAVSTNTTSVTACNSGPMTTGSANDFLVAACGNDGSSSTSVAAGTGWSGGLNAGNPGQFIEMSEYQIGTSSGSYTATSGAIPTEEQATLLVALKHN